MYLNATVTEAAGGSGVVAKGLRHATKDKTVDGAVVLGQERTEERREQERDSAALPEVIVMASGNLGLVSFPTLPGRVTLERIQERYPGLLPTLRAHPGIGFVLVRSEAHGAVVLGARGTSYLDEGRIEGDDPLAPFGPDAARKVKRTDSFDHCADLMINGAYFADVDEVAAFEELVGSHGGMGGAQEHAFVLVPSEPYSFSDVHVAELAARFPAAAVVRVDGEDLFWWGIRTPGARQRLAAALAGHPEPR